MHFDGVKLPKIPCPNPNFVNLDIDIICVMYVDHSYCNPSIDGPIDAI